MKRDWNMIRQMLLDIEALPPDQKGGIGIRCPHELRSVEYGKFMYHYDWMLDAKLITQDINATLSHETDRLTWQGAELLDMIRNENDWQMMTDHAENVGIALTVAHIEMLHRLFVGDAARQDVNLDAGMFRAFTSTRTPPSA